MSQQIIDFLANRYSCGKLSAPAPSQEELQQILAVALRAPDHGGLRPTNLVVIEGVGLNKLGDIFAKAVTHDGGDESKVDKARKMPLRAPLMIAVIAKVVEHPKVPPIEQIQTAGCATFSMQQMAMALGFNGIWRTGELARHPVVRAAFSLSEADELVGFLYLGTEQGATQCRKAINLSNSVDYWSS